MKQVWYCEGCDIQGSCTIPLGADAMDGIRRVEQAHHDKNIICHGINGYSKVRIKAPGCSAKEWKQVRVNGHEQFAAQREARGGR